jgi:hypothetical protein
MTRIDSKNLVENAGEFAQLAITAILSRMDGKKLLIRNRELEEAWKNHIVLEFTDEGVVMVLGKGGVPQNPEASARYFNNAKKGTWPEESTTKTSPNVPAPPATPQGTGC